MQLLIERTHDVFDFFIMDGDEGFAALLGLRVPDSRSVADFINDNIELLVMGAQSLRRITYIDGKLIVHNSHNTCEILIDLEKNNIVTEFTKLL